MLFPMGVRAPKPVTTTRLNTINFFFYLKTNKTHAFFTVLLLQRAMGGTINIVLIENQSRI
jgi:hypothetical protein